MLPSHPISSHLISCQPRPSVVIIPSHPIPSPASAHHHHHQVSLPPPHYFIYLTSPRPAQPSYYHPGRPPSLLSSCSWPPAAPASKSRSGCTTAARTGGWRRWARRRESWKGWAGRWGPPRLVGWRRFWRTSRIGPFSSWLGGCEYVRRWLVCVRLLINVFGGRWGDSWSSIGWYVCVEKCMIWWLAPGRFVGGSLSPCSGIMCCWSRRGRYGILIVGGHQGVSVSWNPRDWDGIKMTKWQICSLVWDWPFACAVWWWESDRAQWSYSQSQVW